MRVILFLFLAVLVSSPQSEAQSYSPYYYYWEENAVHDSVCFRVNIHGDLKNGVPVSTSPRKDDDQACLKSRPKVDHCEWVLDDHQNSVCDYVTYSEGKPIRKRIEHDATTRPWELCKKAMPHDTVYALKLIDGVNQCYKVNAATQFAKEGSTFNLRANDQLNECVALQQKTCHAITPDFLDQTLAELKNKLSY